MLAMNGRLLMIGILVARPVILAGMPRREESQRGRRKNNDGRYQSESLAQLRISEDPAEKRACNGTFRTLAEMFMSGDMAEVLV